MGEGPSGPFEERDRARELSRRRFLQAALVAGGAAAIGGAGLSSAAGAAAPSGAHHRPRRWPPGVVREPGTRPFPNRPEGTDMLPQIEHVVVYMQENHSFDSYFGTLGRVDGLPRGRHGLPRSWSYGAGGSKVRSFHQLDTCDSISGDHSWTGSHRSWNGGRMDQFAAVSGNHVMGYYDETNLPFYNGLAQHFPICDRWFSSVMGPTHPNRRFMIAGTAAGMTVTSAAEVIAHPVAPNGTIFDRLDALGITWTDYAIDIWDVLLFPGNDFASFWANTADNRKYFADFLDDCRNGTLPQVSFIGPGTQDQYDEGSRDVHNGEAYSASIMHALFNSPLWPKTALLFCYDEHGGCYDHVPPPAAIPPDDIAPRLTPDDAPGAYDRYGIRVPGFVVSPYARRHHVSHVVRDHTAILKFVETKWNIGALTRRDANSDDLLDCFDFRRPSFPEPPSLPNPGIPPTGSPCQPQPIPPGAFGDPPTP